MNKEDKLKDELNRLRNYETMYLKIVNSSSYKWFKLFENEFVKGSIKSKVKFIGRLVQLIYRYFIKTPVKNRINSRKVSSNKSENKTFPDINVAFISDTFTYNLFKDEFNIHHITPTNWKKTFQNEKIDLFFMEFVWKGYNDSWLGFRNKLNNKDYVIYEIIEYCNEHNIPTALWNKEDPMYFDFSIDLARHFDNVFTVEESLIYRYKEILKHDNVYWLSYGVNPRIHNPINKKALPEKDIIFAGTYYRNHPERVKDYHKILYPCLKYKFDIFTRESQETGNIDNRFPDEYQKHIKGSLPYSKVIDKTKEYKLMINVNAVRADAFSRRAVESIALGTPVISTWNRGLETIYGDLIPLTKSIEETECYLDKYINSDFERDKLFMKAFRKILNEHTSTHKIIQIFDKTGIDKKIEKPLISVIAVTNKKRYIKRIFENYRRQNYQNKELIIVINTMDIDKKLFTDEISEGENIKVFQTEGKMTLGECLNNAVSGSKGELIAKFDDDDLYSPHYLTDQYNAFIYTDADIIGKTAYLCYLEGNDSTYLFSMSALTGENNYTDKLVSGATFVWKRKVSDKIKFKNSNTGEDVNFIKEAHKHNFRVYSTNRYGFLRYRSKEIENHTWKITDEEISEQGIFLYKGLNTDKVFI
ncbi:MAG: glycosyltransferase [Spirochaetota bacterium]